MVALSKVFRSGIPRLASARVAIYVAFGLSTLTMARILGAKTFGEYSSAVAVASIALVLNYFGQDQLFLNKTIGEDSLRHRNVQVAMFNIFILTFSALFWPNLDATVRLCAEVYGLAAVCQLLLLPHLTISLHKLDFKERALRELASRGTWPVLGLLIGWLIGPTPLSFAVGLLVVGLGILVGKLRRDDFREFGRRIPADQLRAGIAYAASGAFFVIYFQSDVGVLASMAPARVVGLYAAATTILQASLIFSTLLSNDVLRSRLYKLTPHTRAFRKTAIDSGILVTAIGILLGGFVVVASPLLLEIAYGSGFADASGYLRIFGLVIAIFYFSGWLQNILIASGSLIAVVTIQCVLAVGNVVGNILVIPKFSATGSAWITVICELGATLAFGFVLNRKKYLRVKPWENLSHREVQLGDESTSLGEIGVYLPQRDGGHPRYGLAFSSALAQIHTSRVYFVTSTDLALEVRDSALCVERILPSLKARESFSFRLSWAASRVWHFSKRDFMLIRWMRARKELGILHLQQLPSPWMAPFVVRQAHRSGVKVAATVHNVRPHGAQNSPGLQERLQRQLLKKCDLLFVHQGIDITMAADALGVDESKISVIEHGLFEEDCEPPRLDEKKLLLLGTLSPYKGVAEMVEAMKKLPEFHLSIYGRSGDDAYIEKCQEASGQNVSWHVGFVPDEDIAKAYSLSTVAVFPYREFNAQSGALHLALGSGRPVLTTDAGGIATVVRKFNCGVVAEDSTPEALVRALRWLFDPVNLARSLEGVERARGALSWKVAAQQSLSAIEKVDAIHGK